jgi:hypothetical protein
VVLVSLPDSSHCAPIDVRRKVQTVRNARASVRLAKRQRARAALRKGDMSHSPEDSDMLSWYHSLSSLVVSAALCFAPDDTEKFLFTDNFNNNSVGGIWNQHATGGLSVSELNHRLQFSANGATAPLSAAGLEIRPWGANIRRDFQIEVDSTMALNNVTGNRRVFLGVGFAHPGTFPTDNIVLGVGVVRQSNGMFLGWMKFQDGVLIDSDGTEITAVNGQINIEFDKSDDELRISRNGETVIYDGFFAEFGAADPNEPLVISIGCVTLNGNIAFPANRVRLDNFQFNGFKRTRTP